MHESPALPRPDTRLTGWKEIATYLVKGVRTVQRWEKVYGLPVHRIGEDGGEIIYAFTREIDAWLDEFERRRRSGAIVDEGGPASTADIETSGGLADPEHRDRRTATDSPLPGGDATHPRQPARHGRSIGTWIVVTIAIVAAGTGIAWQVRQHPAPPQLVQPAAWRVEADTLIVLDGQQRELWRHPFDFDLQESVYLPNPEVALIPAERGVVDVVDLDNDGSREVVFAARTNDTERAALYVFNADGSKRFEYHPAPTVTTGDKTFAPPWRVRGFVRTRNADGTRTLWVVFIHQLWFPSRLDQLDASGRVLSSYVSNGYISTVDLGTWQGAPAIFVGATNNEHRGASLAIFRGTRVRGSAPAANPNYRCTNCEAAGPDAFIVFPRSCIRMIRDEQADITRTEVDANGRLQVAVLQGREPIPPSTATVGVPAYYDIAGDLSEASVEVSRELGLMHRIVREQGRLDHDLGARDRDTLLPLLKWDGARFMPLAAGEMRR